MSMNALMDTPHTARAMSSIFFASDNSLSLDSSTISTTLAPLLFLDTNGSLPPDLGLVVAIPLIFGLTFVDRCSWVEDDGDGCSGTTRRAALLKEPGALRVFDDGAKDSTTQSFVLAKTKAVANAARPDLLIVNIVPGDRQVYVPIKREV